MKKIQIVVDDTPIEITGETLLVTTSMNANQPTALIVRDGESKIAEFNKWTYWKKIE